LGKVEARSEKNLGKSLFPEMLQNQNLVVKRKGFVVEMD
jgi:hypothetical protein